MSATDRGPSEECSHLASAAVMVGTPGVLVGATLWWVFRDQGAAVNAFLGGILSLVVFTVGVIAVQSALGREAGRPVGAAFGVLGLQLAATALAMWALTSQSWSEPRAAVTTFIAVGVMVQAGLVWAALRVRATVEPSPQDSRIERVS